MSFLRASRFCSSTRPAFLEAQIEAGDMEYELASAHLDDCLALARDCYKLYTSIDDSLRRIANQAFLRTRDGRRINSYKPQLFRMQEAAEREGQL